MKVIKLTKPGALLVGLIFLGAGCVYQTTAPTSTPTTSTTNEAKRYVVNDQKKCESARFTCNEGENYFTDEKGCGCEKKTSPDNPPICTMEYKPVCGEVEVQCIKAPCLPIKQTFGNDCMAKAAKAKNITQGECKEQASDMIKVTNPEQNQVVGSPLTVKGQAKGNWFFEASFPIEIVDTKGTRLGQGIAQAKGDWMTVDYVTFEGKIEFKKGAAQEGFVIFRNDNPSGDPAKALEVKIPVKF